MTKQQSKPTEVAYYEFCRTYDRIKFPFLFPKWSELPAGIQFLWEMTAVEFSLVPLDEEAATEKLEEAGKATLAHTLFLRRHRS